MLCRITIQREGKIETLAIQATTLDLHPKYQTFVHREYGYYTNPNGKDYKKWVVSEATSGASITDGRTRKEAIENARAKIASVGGPGFDSAIANYRKKYGVNLDQTV